MAKFELVLSNGKSVESNRGDELQCFLQSRGEGIAPKPQPKPKVKRKKMKKG